MKLFDLVDETILLLNSNFDRYTKIEQYISTYLDATVCSNENYIGKTSRVKSENSLRNKIVKRKYYLEYDNAQDVIDNLSDVIGITLECRFKEDEVNIYNELKSHFIIDENEFSKTKDDSGIFMNFSMNQPQTQKNGFDIYRIDGYFCNEGEKTNFELQIKSLINTFWSGIEHEVIYKNNNYLLFDSFLKHLLLSVKDNLDVIDRQLSQIYNEMTHKGNDSIGMDGTNFKGFLGKEINNVFSNKLKETSEIDIDIKKLSALLSHYLYLEEFVSAESPQLVMLNYFERIDLLSKTDMDFTAKINIKNGDKNRNAFQTIMGDYCLNIMNVDFDWHVLFAMLFMLKDDEAIVKFNSFITFIQNLIFEPRWFNESCAIINAEGKYPTIMSDLYSSVAQVLVNQKSVEVIYEEKLYSVMVEVRIFVDELINQVNELDNVNMNELFKEFEVKLDKLFLK